MSATATEERDDQLVAAPSRTKLFLARRDGLRLVKTPRYPKYGPGGRTVGEEPGEAVQFVNARLDVPLEGEMTLEDGRKADAAEVLAWLEKHPRLGDVEEGFWPVDQTAPAPSKAELAALMTAATQLDVEKLRAFIEQERAGWGREDLLETAEGALRQVLEMRAAAEAQALAQQAERERAEAERLAAMEKAKAEAEERAAAKAAQDPAGQE